MLIRGLYLLAALCLLSSGAWAQTATVTVTSAYGVGFGTVSVTNLTNPGPATVCNFAATPNLNCSIPRVSVNDNLALSTAAASGFVVTGGTGICGGVTTGAYQFKVTAISTPCGIAGGYPLKVTAADAGVVAAAITSSGSHCGLPGTAGQSCDLAVAPGTLSLTIGLAANTTIVSGTGLCTNAAPTANPFRITVPASPSGLACGINSKSTPPPSPLPQSGWWWTGAQPDNHLRFGLQVNGTVTPKALLGTVYTFRGDGSAVWYLVNAVLNGDGTAYEGTASEFSGGGGLTGSNGGPSGLKTIVANVTFTFASPTTATVMWSPRAGGSNTMLTLTRYSFSTTGAPLTAFAPVPGAYNPVQNPNSIGYFVEMQGTASAPYAYFGASYFDSKGRATWAVSNTLVYRNPVTRYPAKGAQSGWQVTALLDGYSGGAPIGMPAKTPKAVPGSKAVAILGSSTNSVAIAGGRPAALTRTIGWGLSTSPFWLQIVDNSPSIKTAYVTFFPATSAKVSYVNQKGKLVAFPRFTSVALSTIANGALLASSTQVNGDLYISNQPLQATATNPRTKKTSCAPVSPGNNAAPSLTSTTDCNIGTRWQFIEVGGDYDVTYINVYSIPLSINQGSTSQGNATTAQLQALEKALGGLSGGKAVYPANSQGTSKFIRDIGPANANGSADPLLTPFPSFSNYIGTTFNATTGQPVTPINISNSYNGNSPSSSTTICTGNGGKAFKAQTYSGAPTYKGNTLTLTGSGGVVGDFTITAMTPIQPTPSGCGKPTNPASCYSPTVTPADLSAALYTAVLSYSVSGAGGACSAGQVESNGANDVFSVVVRDFLVSMASGFANSTVPAPATLSPPNPPASTYGRMTSVQWSNSAAKLFGGVQPSTLPPSASYNYNPWGAIVFGLFGSQVYGFQYSDYFSAAGPLGNPLLTVQPSIPVQLLLLNDGS